MKRINELAKKIESMQKDIAAMEREMEELRVAELKKVEMKRNESSTSLLFNGRVINASRNRYGRISVKEKGRFLDADYIGSIHDLRFDIATGRI